MGNSSSSSLEKRLEMIDNMKRGPGSSHETGIKPDFKQQAKEYKRELRAQRHAQRREEHKEREEAQSSSSSSEKISNSKPYRLCERCYIGYIYRSGGGCDHCGG